MPRPLVGIDLDGVVALEDYNAYHKAKAEGVSVLRQYYKTLKVNEAFVTELQRNYHRYRFIIVTARRDDVPDIKQITLDWLKEHRLDALFIDVVFTGNAWKWPWLMWHGVIAHIDNDYSNLKWCPFMYRLSYHSFPRHNWFYDNVRTPWKDVHSFCSPTWSQNLFDFLNKVCYTK